MTSQPKIVAFDPAERAGAAANEQQSRAVKVEVRLPDAPDNHPNIPRSKVGVLLVNLGTPDAPTSSAVKRYLAEFLSDRRIVDYPRLLWTPLLHGVILNVRPAKTARAYASIWREESDESPLRFHTRTLADRLKERFNDDVEVDWAMRYGEPAVADRMAALKADGCDRILIVPLYPQYSVTTTASVHDAVFNAVKSAWWQPALRMAPAFHDHPAYISALAASAEAHLKPLDWTPERVILSFHGLPERYLQAGDPYHCHCAKTARLLREAMGWEKDYAPLTFQSKFGPEKWLTPATDDTITTLAEQGVKNVAVMTPGFVADCLETLEEIAIAGRESFEEHGGEKFTAIPCLNASDEMTDLVEALVETETAGWLNANARAVR
ncbi:MAG: ferrochelatase [Pseudomonadota bacterium]